MGLLNKKEPQRPYLDVGKNYSVRWYQDTNEFKISYTALEEALEDYSTLLFPQIYPNQAPFDTVIQNLKAILWHNSDNIGISLTLLIKEAYKSNLKDLDLFLVSWLSLPNNIEEMFIRQFNEFKGRQAKTLDEVNSIRKKFNTLK